MRVKRLDKWVYQILATGEEVSLLRDGLRSLNPDNKLSISMARLMEIQLDGILDETKAKGE